MLLKKSARAKFLLLAKAIKEAFVLSGLLSTFAAVLFLVTQTGDKTEGVYDFSVEPVTFLADMTKL